MTKHDKQINKVCGLKCLSANYNLVLITWEMQMTWHLYGINYECYLSVVLASQEHHMQL